MKHKLTNLEKKIILAEAVLVLGILIFLFFSTAPSHIYPLQGMVVSEPDFVFEIENGEEVVLSVDKSFANPIVLKEGADITLPPGEYYWKVRSKLRESDVKTFKIQGRVGLDLKEKEENYELQNSGNVGLDVTKENEGVISSMTIDVGENKIVEKDNSKYEGRQE